jgi:methylated-DNA-protein-cysteine methyltransferase related protein
MKRPNNSGAYPRIWDVVAQIPRGKVASYATIARAAGFASHARMAGYALHHLPDGLEIPWHRVVNAAGRISLGGESGKRQRQLLMEEGVAFKLDRIDMEEFGWKPDRKKRPQKR